MVATPPSLAHRGLENIRNHKRLRTRTFQTQRGVTEIDETCVSAARRSTRPRGRSIDRCDRARGRAGSESWCFSPHLHGREVEEQPCEENRRRNPNFYRCKVGFYFEKCGLFSPLLNWASCLLEPQGVFIRTLATAAERAVSGGGGAYRLRWCWRPPPSR